MIQDKNETWHKLAESQAEIKFDANNLATVQVAEKIITLALHDNQVFACTHKCPHAGGILADGFVDGIGNIVCPVHKYKFSLFNGRNISGEGYFLKCFNVEQREDGLYVCLG